MSRQYFIKRDDRIRGPFSAKQVKALIDSDKLRNGDFIGIDSKDNWQSIEEFIRSITENNLPVVANVKLANNVLGKRVASYLCPHCNDKLRSAEKMIGEIEYCPSCNNAFRISKNVRHLFEEERAKAREEKERKQKRRLIQKEQAEKKIRERAKQARAVANAEKGSEGKSRNAPTPPTPETKDDQITCPRCGSSQLTANKKGFGLKNAVVGGLLLGPLGLLGGAVGGGKVVITCLKCGNSWNAGQA